MNEQLIVASRQALEALERLDQYAHEVGPEITALRTAIEAAEKQEPVTIDGNTSDGYHTFNELYEFRKAYNAALFNEWAAVGKCSVHKSWRHHDGELCFGGGWFIVVAVLPDGQISNHYEAKDWSLFAVPETERALFEFDGHTGSDVVSRLKSYTPPPAAPVQEPDWSHPKMQALIGADARNRITIDLVWRILENPNGEYTASDMEYWDAIHDAVQAAAQRQWVDLTDEEIKITWRDIDGSEGMLIRFARAIEAKLKEKNT